MTYIFDGRKVARDRKAKLIGKMRKVTSKPNLVSILVGEDPASKLYLSLKKKAAEETGCQLSIVNYQTSTKLEDVISEIQKLNKDKSVHGIMLQLPLPHKFSKADRDRVIDAIAQEKDVDGMHIDSPFLTPVVKAIMIALDTANENIVRQPLKTRSRKVVVVGSQGFVGKRLRKALAEENYEVTGVHRKTKNFAEEIRKADIVISATGKKHIVTGDIIQKGSVIIDVGSPDPDVDKASVEAKAAFLSPVPGGVGPLTVICLIENLVDAASK